LPHPPAVEQNWKYVYGITGTVSGAMYDSTIEDRGIIHSGEITISSKTLPILQNHTMTYNIISSFFTISSILKCPFLNHMQPLFKITISSVYVLHFCVISFMFSFWRPPSSSSTALVILGGAQCTNFFASQGGIERLPIIGEIISSDALT
jgi:hypothetical protein